MHDDARTNIAIALTAAEKGAAVANYCEVTGLIKENGRAAGVSVLDRVTSQRFDVRAKAVVFCGGPYTDALRKLGDEKAEDAVAGASGTHVVLPAVWKSTSELGLWLRRQHRVDGVGRPKLDFHTGYRATTALETKAYWIITPRMAGSCFFCRGSDIRW